MKTKHLFTFFVLLSLTSSGVLLTEVSSIAQNGVRTSDKKNTEPKAAEKTTPSSETPATSSVPDIAVPSVTPAASSAVKGVSKTDGSDSLISLILSSLSGLFHLLEIAGLVWAYLKIQQLTEKSRDSRSQIKSLTDRLSVSEQKQKTQGDQLKTIGSEAANARNLTSRMNAIEQASQRKPNDIGYAEPAYNLPSLEFKKAVVTLPQREVETLDSIDISSYLIPKFQGVDVGVSGSLYPFLDIYQQNPDSFKNQYVPKAVSEDADNLQKRWSGDTKEIILGEDRRGNYWLFKDGITTYLIPSPKLKVNDINMRTAGGLFDCNNYTPGYQSMTVVSPAIVSSQLGANERWKLEQKGVLGFT
jgi:hypothetical protein